MIATGNPSSRYEVATYYEDYSESTYFVRMNGAKKIFDEKKEDFKQNKSIKKILFNEVILKNNEIITEPIEKIEREDSE